MTKQEKEKSLIDMAREHMEEAGAKPEQGVAVPEPPAVTRESEGAATQKAVPKPVATDQVPAKDHVDGKLSDAIDTLLANVTTTQDWRAVKLPSRGKAYVECDEHIMIKPFTFAQERKLRSIKNANQGAKVINNLIDECTEGLDFQSMTLEDKNYILFKIREISYGKEYTIVATCLTCDAKNNLTVDISEVPVTYAPDDYKEPFSCMLPDSQQPVTFVSPRCKDENYLADAEKLTDNLWRFVLSVGEYSEERIIKGFFQKTTVRDVAFFRKELLKDRYGMNKEMSFDCANCGEVSESLMPFTESFFSVS